MAKRTKKTTKPREREIALDDAPVRPYDHAPHLGEILGQDRAVGVLDAALRAEKIHHAWIFQGPPGVGKFSTALGFARVLLDPTSTPDLAGLIRPDPHSPAQGLIDSASHPDLHVVRKTLAVHSRKPQVRSAKQTNIPVEVVREFLLEPAARTRQLAGRSPAGKVLIVDEAELLIREGQNAMLKTLEEPPGGTVLILVTSRESALLTTVRSRCQRVGFGPLSPETMRAWLDREEIDAGRWLIGAAAGSPGQLLRMRDLDIEAWREPIEAMLADVERERYPVAFGATASAMIDDAAKRMVENDPRASKEAANRAAASILMRIVAGRARRKMADANDPALAERWAGAIEGVREAEGLIDRNVPMLFVMERLGLAIFGAMEGEAVG